MKKQKQKRKGRSTQDFIGIRSFSRYGLSTGKGELVFFVVSPTNISVLSQINIEIKIRHLMMVLSAVPDIEISCLDSCECFDDNKHYITKRLKEESNPKVREALKKDLDFLDNIQVEMSTARQFMFIARMRKENEEQVFQAVNRIEKTISEQGFEVRRLIKNDIKRILAIYFGASMNGEMMGDTDGEIYMEEDLKQCGIKN